jgi:hypothetical protein
MKMVFISIYGTKFIQLIRIYIFEFTTSSKENIYYNLHDEIM